MSEQLTNYNLNKSRAEDPFAPSTRLADMLLTDPDLCSDLTQESIKLSPTLNGYRPPRTVMRDRKRVDEYEAKFGDFVFSGMVLLAHEPDQLSRAVRLNFIFKEVDVPMHPDLANMMTVNSGEFNAQLQLIMHAEQQMLPIIVENSQDPAWRYELLKSIAAASFDDSSSVEGSAEQSVMAALCRPSLRGSIPDGPTFLDYLNSELQDGKFDSKMLLDIIKHERYIGSHSPINQLIVFAKSLLPDIDDDNLLHSVQSSYDSWPDIAKKISDTAMQQYKDAVAGVIHKRQSVINSLKFDRTEDELAYEFKQELQKQYAMAQAPPPLNTQPQRKKRVKVARNTLLQANDEAAEIQVEKTPVSEYTFSIRNDDYTTMTPKELIESKTRANDRSLKEGLESMVEYVSTNILKPAKSAGIKPLRAPHLGQKVFEFKPAEAAGFSTKHRQVKATRFIFKVLEREDSAKTVAPIDFVLRADLDKWIANQA